RCFILQKRRDLPDGDPRSTEEKNDIGNPERLPVDFFYIFPYYFPSGHAPAGLFRPAGQRSSSLRKGQRGDVQHISAPAPPPCLRILSLFLHHSSRLSSSTPFLYSVVKVLSYSF